MRTKILSILMMVLFAALGLIATACSDGGEDPACVDSDGDTFGVNCVPGPDCDDTDPLCHEGDCCDAGECIDGDNDGYGSPASNDCTHDALDCDDNDGAIHPGATEVCNGADDDCDGNTDDGEISCGVGACQVTADACAGGTDNTCTPLTPPETSETTCDDGIDNDCDGTADDQDLDCQTCEDGDSDGYGQYCELGSDCDDSNADINPGATEICDGLDNDCDDATDEDDVCADCVDNDSDGYDAVSANCPTGNDCDDSDADINPGQVENPFNHIDDDCDDVVDETVDSPLQGQVVFNEILIDGTCDQDANGDGDIDSITDEFVEILNLSGGTLDMSGWTLYDSDIAIARHTFPEGASLPDGEVFVVFGGEPGLEDVTGTQFVGAINSDSGLQYGLSLNNSDGDSITLYDEQLRVVAMFAYGDAGNHAIVLDESATRSPDGTGTFQPHTQAASDAEIIFSPGTKLDGSAFP